MHTHVLRVNLFTARTTIETHHQRTNTNGVFVCAVSLFQNIIVVICLFEAESIQKFASTFTFESFEANIEKC